VYNIPRFKGMDAPVGANWASPTEFYILAGITPLKSAKMAQCSWRLKSKGWTCPKPSSSACRRHRSRRRRKRGQKIALETIAELRGDTWCAWHTHHGDSRRRSACPELVKAAGLSPAPPNR